MNEPLKALDFSFEQTAIVNKIIHDLCIGLCCPMYSRVPKNQLCPIELVGGKLPMCYVGSFGERPKRKVLIEESARLADKNGLRRNEIGSMVRILQAISIANKQDIYRFNRIHPPTLKLSELVLDIKRRKRKGEYRGNAESVHRGAYRYVLRS